MQSHLNELYAGDPEPDSATVAAVQEAFARFVGDVEFPCLGAKSVLRRGKLRHSVRRNMTSRETARLLVHDLAHFSEASDWSQELSSYVVSFMTATGNSEKDFERGLWQLLQQVHDFDAKAWDPGVSSDPRSPHFGFSVAGRAYFLIGMHPAASRRSRRFTYPTIVFNAHEQFERLRAEGRFVGLKERIRVRDTRLQGCPNPMALDHGDASEALQYSGRQRPSTWTPEFRP